MTRGYYKTTGLPINTTHKLSYDRFHRIWRAIYLRCNDKENLIYGGRGIKCEWKSFEEFKNDMHDSYLEHCEKFGVKNTTIDRINNDWDYYKENCKWASMTEQANNRRTNHYLLFNGKKQSMANWARELNMTYDTIKLRIKRGWSIEKTLTTQGR